MFLNKPFPDITTQLAGSIRFFFRSHEGVKVEEYRTPRRKWWKLPDDLGGTRTLDQRINLPSGERRITLRQEPAEAL